MGSASSAANGRPTLQQMISNVKIGTRVDALDANGIWWPATVVEMQAEGKPFVRVRCENEYERKISLAPGPRNDKRVQKLIAPLGTHTREGLTAAAAAEQLGPVLRSRKNGAGEDLVDGMHHTDLDEGADDDGGDVIPPYKAFGRSSRSKKSPSVGSASSDGCIKNWMRIGAQIDVLDIYVSNKTRKKTRKWRPATIIRVRNPELYVNFEGWDDEHNIWVDASKEANRLDQRGVHTGTRRNGGGNNRNGVSSGLEDIPPASGSTGGMYGLNVGDQCYCKDEYISKNTMEPAWAWRPAEVTDIDGTKYKIHFTGWSDKWDDWFEIDGGRVMTVEDYEISGVTDSASVGGSGAGMHPKTGAKKGAGGLGAAAVGEGGETLANLSKIPVHMVMPPTNGQGIVGLDNLGNTCFMNSILQCLLNTAPLAAYFLNEDHLREKNIKSPMQGKFAGAFGDFMSDYWSTRSQGIARAPRQLKLVIAKFARQFDGFAQHDAQELLRYLLEGLHEDLNRVRTKPAYEEIKDDPGMSEPDKCDVWWDNYEQRNDSSIKDIFCGQLRSYVTCRTCNNRSSAYDPFWDLSLPLPRRKSKCSIKDCLKLFAGDEVLAGDDAYYCGKCKKHRKSTKNMSIQRWPLVLCLHAKRFNGRGKLKTKVSFPSVDLDLSSIDSVISETAPPNQPPPVYQLIGVSNHMGSLHSGHYTADCLSPVSRNWMHYDDSRVSPTSVSELSTSNAYILFYARADLSSYNP